MRKDIEPRGEGLRRLLGRVMILEIFVILLLIILSVLSPSLLSALGDSPLLPALVALMVMVPIVWLILTAMSGSGEDDGEEEEAETEEDLPVPAGDFPDYSFIRVQRLSGPDAITSRDRVILLTREGIYEISAESRAPGAVVSLCFKGGALWIRGQKDIPLESGRPLILYSNSAAGTRIPQYALTFIHGKEAPHA